MRPRPARHRDPLPRPRTRRRTRATTRRRRPLPHRRWSPATAGRRSYVAVTSQRRAISRASARKPRQQSCTALAWPPMAPSAGRRANMGLRTSWACGIRLRKCLRVARQLESSSMKDAAPRRYYTRDACLNSRIETGRQDPARFRFGEPVGGNRTSAGGIVLTGGCANAACIVVKIGPSQDLGISFSEAEPERCRASEHHVKTVTTHHAKTHLSRLLREVHAGETIVILSGSAPVAQLIAIRPERASRPPVGTRTSAASPRPFRSTAGGCSDQGERGRPDPRRRRPPISSEPPVGRVRSDDNEMDHVALAN